MSKYRCILLVEDEADLSAILKMVLSFENYRVLTAHSREEAMAIWALEKANIQILIADIFLPGNVKGTDIAYELLKEKPFLNVVFMSSYNYEFLSVAIRDKINLIQNYTFIAKPCRPKDFVKKLESSFNQNENGPNIQ